MHILVMGVGPIGIEYTNILKALGHTVQAHGRSPAGCASFEAATGVPATAGGIDGLGGSLPETAVVAVGEAQLGVAVLALIERGVKHILVEKPGAANVEELKAISAAAAAAGCDVRIGYNRRFHASTLKAREIIAEDGGVRTFHFEFTEWSHRIEPLQKEAGVKEEWFLHNSSHVVDLAFHLGGWPTTLHALTAGELSWHRHARHVGSGQTESGALFSYFADWQGPGRWSVEMITPKHRLIFRPLEQLMIQQIGSVVQEPVAIDNQLDLDYKPGFYRQTQAFLDAPASLLSIDEQLAHATVYLSMNPPA